MLLFGRVFLSPKSFYRRHIWNRRWMRAVTWIVSGILSSLFHVNPGIVALIVAIIVAYVALYLSKPKEKWQYVVTFFNGFLIYVTVVGATSFPPYINQQTAGVVQKERPAIRTVLVRPWITPGLLGFIFGVSLWVFQVVFCRKAS